MSSSLAPGDAVRAQREPDLSFEPCVVKSVQTDEAGAVACTLRFEDGFLLHDVSSDAVFAVKAGRESTSDECAAAHKAALALLAGGPAESADGGYDAAVLPLLPALPECEAGDDAACADFGFAARYKEVGNGLFKEGQHAWALRTYLVGVTLLQRLCFPREPEALYYDLEAGAVGVACFSNAALCALKLCRRPEATRTARAARGALLLHCALSQGTVPPCTAPFLARCLPYLPCTGHRSH